MAEVKPNSEIFIELFSEIEQKLKTICNDEFHSTFSDLLRKARGINAVVNQYASDLKEFSQLRNAIVHTRRENFVIAEPHNDVIKEIRHIHSLLHNPPRVSSVMIKNPYYTSSDGSIFDLLTTFSEKNIMRCPVIDNGAVTCLITAKTISRWLTSKKQNKVDINGTKISELVPFTEKTDYSIIGENIDIISLVGMFKNSIKRGTYIQAVLITKNGQPNSPLVGIITPSDLPLIIERMNLS
ncbi:MAG TPA: CBS domain-containing protein [Tenuifilaceae bacterium]|nr:CBS domain-containing protein [Tenuifilaceae bacterium]